MRKMILWICIGLMSNLLYAQDEGNKVWKPQPLGHDSILMGGALLPIGSAVSGKIVVLGLPENRISLFPNQQNDLRQIISAAKSLNCQRIFLPMPASYQVLFEIFNGKKLPEWADKVPGLNGEFRLSNLNDKGEKLFGYSVDYGNDATWMIFSQLLPSTTLGVPDSLQNVIFPLLRIGSRFQSFYGMEDEFGIVSDVAGGGFSFKLLVVESFLKFPDLWKKYLGSGFEQASFIIKGIQAGLKSFEMEEKGLLPLGEIFDDQYATDLIARQLNNSDNSQVLIVGENRNSRKFHEAWEYPGIAYRLAQKGYKDKLYTIGLIEITGVGASFQPDNDLGPLFDLQEGNWSETLGYGFHVIIPNKADTIERALLQRYSSVILHRIKEETEEVLAVEGEFQETRPSFSVDTMAEVPPQVEETTPVMEGMPEESERKPRVYTINRWRFSDFSFGIAQPSFAGVNRFMTENGFQEFNKNLMFYEISSGFLRNRKLFRETYFQAGIPIWVKPGDTSSVRFNTFSLGFRIGKDLTRSKRFNATLGLNMGYGLSRLSYIVNRSSDPFLKIGFTNSTIFSVNNPSFLLGPYFDIRYFLNRLVIFGKTTYNLDVSAKEWREGKNPIMNNYGFSFSGVQIQAGFGFVLDARKPFRF